MNIEVIKNQLEVLYGSEVRYLKELKDYFVITLNNSSKAILVLKDNSNIITFESIDWYTRHGIGIGNIDGKKILINGISKALTIEYKNVAYINRNNFALSLNTTNCYALFGNGGIQLTEHEYRVLEPAQVMNNSDSELVCIGYRLEKGKMTGYLIGNEGRVISNGFAYIYMFHEDVARVRYHHGGEGFVTIDGKELLIGIEDIVETYDFYTKGVFRRKNGLWYTVTKSGRRIEQIDFKNIRKYLTYSDQVGLGLDC